MPELSDSLSEINSRALLVRLLTYAIRCPEVARVATEKLSPIHFNESTQLEFLIVWRVASALWEEYEQVPEAQHVADLAVNTMMLQGYAEPVFHESARRLVVEIYAFTETPWNADYGLRLLNAFFNGVFIRDLAKLAERFGGKERGDAAEAVMQAHQSLQLGVNPPLDPFDLVVNVPTFKSRQPTGVGFWDMLTGGGTSENECYGILGPTGGGKTLLAVQLACSMAERGQDVEYFTYEQSAKELQPRILSCAAKISSIRISGKCWADIDEAAKKKITIAADICKNRLHVHDRSSEGSSISDIVNTVRQRIDEGRTPRMVIVDWIWPLILRITATSQRRNEQERMVLQKATDDFKAAASKYGVTFLLLHQISTEMAKKSPSKKPEWFNSAEAGSFAWLLHYCIAIGRADTQGYCWMVGSKARNAKKQSALVLLNGEFNRFESTKQSMIYDERRQEFIDEGNVNKMPGVRTVATVDDKVIGQSDESPQDEQDDYAAGGGAGVV